MKTYSGGPYAKIIAIIHTDEPVIGYDVYHETLSSILFGPFLQINEADFIWSYDPKYQFCPYAQLSLAAAPEDVS